MPQLRFKDYLVVAGGVLLIALSISFAHVNPVGGTGSAPVTVVNTPLPVTVGNFPASVTGSVSITNDATMPVPVRDVDNGPRQAVQLSFSGAGAPSACANAASIGVGAGLPPGGADYVVPTGKRFVIQSVTVSAQLNANCVGIACPPAQPLQSNITTSAQAASGTEVYRHYLPPLVFQGGGNGFGDSGVVFHQTAGNLNRIF